jgi:hypothetical protein
MGILSAGCEAPAPPKAVSIANQRFGAMRIAVAPALNQSGARVFDPVRIADLMASELSYVRGVEVIPVSRVLTALSDDQELVIKSPEHAQAVIERLGADGMLVFAVTEYEPYDPPIVGLAAQLYRAGERPMDGFDPIAMSRRTIPFESSAPQAHLSPIAQKSTVFDARHDSLLRDVQKFAENRTGKDSPLGWREYVVDQQAFVRFCCHETLVGIFGSDLQEHVSQERSVASGTDG